MSSRSDRAVAHRLPVDCCLVTHTLLLAGGYTHHSSAGICLFDRSGPEPVAVVETIEHPSFLALHPNGYIVYAVSEISGFDGGSGGGIVAFLIDRGLRSLIEIDRMPSCLLYTSDAADE